MRHHPHDAATAAGLAAPSSGHSDELAPLGTDAAGAADVGPQTDECLGGNRGIQGEQRSSEHCDSATGRAGRDKLLTTTKAEFAQLGYGLLELSDGSFLATKWTCCRPLADLQSARAFLRQIGGAR